MGFLNRLWHKQYQLLVVSGEAGPTRSYQVRLGYLIATGLVIALLGLGLIGGWFIVLPRLTDYADLQAEKEQLHSYRDKVRHAVLNANEYGLIGADFLRELELAIDLEGQQDQTASVLSGRKGGVFIESIYVNFLENVPTFPPVDGYVTRGQLLHDLDLHANHEGIDIAAPVGELVGAAASGLVVMSHWTEDLGYMIILSHGDGYFTVYGHNQVNLVQPREWVERGQPVALLGDTGISHGPHLHFEIWKDGRSMDPRLFMDLYRRQDVSVETHG